MIKRFYLYVLLLLLTGLTACRQDPRARFCLEEAERLMESCPDSSLSLLESISSPDKLPAEAYATWCLLLTQARDKNYVEHTSDSLINVAVRYFEKRNDPHRKAQAYYCQGRILSDLDISDEALEAYLNAKEQVTQTSDEGLKARIHNHLGGLYWKNMNYQESLASYKKAHQVYAHSADTAGMVNTLYNIGKSWQVMNQLDSASFYCEKALDLIEEKHFRVQKGTVLTSLGNINMDRGDYVTALTYYQEALLSTENPRFLDTRYYNLGDAYRALGQVDSALFYLRKLLESKNLFTQCNANRMLYHLSKETGAYDSAFVHNETYLQLRDSIEHLYRPHELERVKALYNQERMQNRHERQMRESEIRQLVWVILFLASLVVGTFIYSYFNKKLSLQRLRNQLILEQLDKNRKRLKMKEQELSKNSEQLEQIRHSLSNLQQEQECLLAENKEHVRALEENESQRIKAQEELKQTLYEKIRLIHDKDRLLGQQAEQLRLMSKNEKQYKEQIAYFTDEQQKTRQEMEQLRSEMEQETLQLKNEMEHNRSRCKMYESWQKSLIDQNCVLSRVQKRLQTAAWQESDWKTFFENFEQIYPGFLTHLSDCFELSAREIRVICLTKMGLKTGKVASLIDLGEDMTRRIKADIRKRCFATFTESNNLCHIK